METPFQSIPDPFLLGEWRVEPARRLLIRNEEERSLEPKQMHLLLTLAEEPGAVCTRSELLDVVWPDTVVTDHSLTRTISELRRALGEQGGSARYIETIPKRGYRLAAPVRHVPSLSSPGSDGAEGGEDGSWPGTVEMKVAGQSGGVSPQDAAVSSFDEGVERPITVSAKLQHWLLGSMVLILVVALTVIAFNGAREDAPLSSAASLQATPLTSLPGREYSPVLSPDGGYVAFVHVGSQDEAGANITVKAVDGEAIRQLTDGADQDVWPRWRSDGKAVLFQRFNE